MQYIGRIKTPVGIDYSRDVKTPTRRKKIDAGTGASAPTNIPPPPTYETLVAGLPPGFVAKRNSSGELIVADSAVLVGCPCHYHYYLLNDLANIKCKTCTGGTAATRATHKMVEKITKLTFTKVAGAEYVTDTGQKLYIIKNGDPKPPADCVVVVESKSEKAIKSALIGHFGITAVRAAPSLSPDLVYHSDAVPVIVFLRPDQYVTSNNPLLILENCVSF